MSERIPTAPTAPEVDLQQRREQAFARVAAFAENPDNEYAAGPDIQRGTGLNHESVMQLGYGSYDELKNDALTWKAARDEKAAREAQQREHQAAYGAWKADMDASRAKRDEGTKRVDAISYKMKLEHGGELGLKRNPGLAEKIKRAAIAKAEAEGHKVGHLKARAHEVPTNSTAEKRTSELGKLLKQHDEKVLRSQANKKIVSKAPSKEPDVIEKEPGIVWSTSKELALREPGVVARNELDTSFMREFPRDLAYDLATALNDYTKLAAARERSTITPGLTKAKVEAARMRYEELRMKAKYWEIDAMKGKVNGEKVGAELPESDRIAISKLQDKTEAKMIGLGIKFEAELLAEPKGFLAGSRKKFYDWWARQGGGDKFFSKKRLWGNAKKAAVMAAVGLPIGVAAGAAGVFLAGPLVGGVIAAGVGRGVARGFMRGRIEKSATAKSVAAAQYEQRLAAQNESIDNNYTVASDGKTHVSEYVTDVYAEGTQKGVNRNRIRTVGSMAIGAAAGLGGAYLGELAHNALWGGGNHPSQQPSTGHSPNNPPAHPSTPPSAPNTPPAAPEHGLTGQEFTVEHGSGEIREIQEYASAHNYNIKPADAYRIYTELYQEHGTKIIDLAGHGPDTYVISPGNIGLSHPGEGSWYPGIEDELRDKLAKAAA